MQSDEQLIMEIRKGIESSMEVLINRYYKMVFAYIYRNVGEYHLCYDLTQETFIKMIKNIDTFSTEGSFKHWLIKIALNTCRDHYKSQGYKLGQASFTWTDKISEKNEHVIDLIQHKVESEYIRNAVMKLPAYQREAIVLRFYHDLKIKDIASITSSSESTVKSRIMQGLSKLKSILERDKNDEKKQSQY
ncbi:RNA polymerase sigma-70 factor, ECF subfamily [Aneurinibacillus thermoaerophilus]|uniref:RNA polymerase sigma factor n=2 Tax=Aneurinibacillus thermoaerophilus TaxID=143495 RepID=A0A1G7XDG9_ANETH|nr:RNA polymerase sigma factor [Aneurinibacillus thermoaerophilus]SDG82268.1 RNA polymerase sigma-70 factor, ECF subfamily [Aneurinibacillus thermoaerophilus]